MPYILLRKNDRIFGLSNTITFMLLPPHGKTGDDENQRRYHTDSLCRQTRRYDQSRAECDRPDTGFTFSHIDHPVYTTPDLNGCDRDIEKAANY